MYPYPRAYPYMEKCPHSQSFHLRLDLFNALSLSLSHTHTHMHTTTPSSSCREGSLPEVAALKRKRESRQACDRYAHLPSRILITHIWTHTVACTYCPYILISHPDPFNPNLHHTLRLCPPPLPHPHLPPPHHPVRRKGLTQNLLA